MGLVCPADFTYSRWRVAPANPGDEQEIVSFKRRLMKQAYQGLVDEASLADEISACNENHLLQDLRSLSSVVLVARSPGGRLEGTVSLREEGQRGRLFGGFVDTPGQGLGVAMGEALLIAARESGLREVFSAVYEGNESGARAAESLGLRYYGVSRPGIYMPRYTVREYSMRLPSPY